MASQHWRWPGVSAPLPAAPPPRFEPRMEAVRQSRRRNPGMATMRTQDEAPTEVTKASPETANPPVASSAAASEGLCMHTGCAFLCTGLSPRHCCRKCAHTPGLHGPKCEGKLLACKTEGCGYAVTGLTAAHCCRRCRDGGSQTDAWGSHGPHCWRLSATGAKSCDDAAPDAAPSQAASLMDASAASASSQPSDEDFRALEANQAAIAANAERIQALYDELESDLQKAM